MRPLFAPDLQRILGAQCIFKMAVRSLIAQEIYPSPKRIREELMVLTGKESRANEHSLNGRQCKWRGEVFAEHPPMGWVNRTHRSHQHYADHGV